MKIFLHAKHWQVFFILIIIPVILEIYLLSYFIPQTNNSEFMLYFSVMMIIYTIVFFGWIWTLGVNLNKLLPQGISMKINTFRAFVLIPFVYIIALTFLLQYIYYIDTYPLLFPAILIPIHLFLMFCMFYCIWFIAKSLKTVEDDKEVNLSDYACDFFLIWFFPVGIWFIQPRINKLFRQ